MRKIIFSITCVIIVLLYILPLNVEATGNISLVSNKSNVYVGDEFTISINLSGAAVVSLTTKIGIDTSKVEYISGPSNSNFSNGKVIYTWTDPNGGASPISSGTIATFKFKAKSSGNANFTITGDFYDADENAIRPTFTGKTITISEISNNTNGGTSQSSSNTTTNTTTNNTTANNITTNNSGTSTSGGTSGNQTTTTVSSNAYLKSLQLNAEGVSPQFNRKTTQYYITVSNTINEINVIAIPEDSKATVSVTGNKNLQTGLNKISIQVNAPDKKTKKIYMVNVTKTDDPSKANANLENLAVEFCTLNPEFSSEVTDYTVELEQDLATLNILAVPQNQNANVIITGNENLQIGENNITVSVTAQDGVSVKNYNLLINKKELITEKEENVQEENTIEEKSEIKEKNVNGAVIPLITLAVLAGIAGTIYKKLQNKKGKDVNKIK